jgi:hypothetical protein
MLTTRTAGVDDIWPPSSGGCPHPPAVRDEIIRVAREEVTEAECRAAPFAHWYRPFYVAELKVLERQQRQPKEAEIDRLRSENRDLRSRLGLLERWALPDKKGNFPLMDLIVDVVALALGRTRKAIEERIEKIEHAAPVPVPLPSADDLAQLGRQGPAVYYEGIWDPMRSYQAGDMVTKDGAAWVATNAMAAGVKPGEGPTAWKLCVKAPTAGLRKLVEREVRKQLGSKPPVR